MTEPSVRKAGPSLRSRIMIPLAVVIAVAVAMVAALTTAVLRLEFEQALDDRTAVDKAPGSMQRIADELGATLGTESTDPASVLTRALEREGIEASGVLVGDDGSVRAVASRRFEPGDVALEAPDSLRIEIDGPDGRTVIRLESSGWPVPIPGEPSPSRLYLVPNEPPEASPGTAALPSGRVAVLVVAAVGVVALLIAWWSVGRALEPLRQLRGGVRSLDAGALDTRVPTERRDELGELAGAFNAMAASLERQQRLRRRMVDDVAHELRTPLTALRCQLEAMQDGLEPADAEGLASLHEEVLVLSRLVEDLQTLADADAGELRLHPERVDVAESVRQAIRQARAAAGHDVDPQAAVPEGLTAWADPVRVRQVLGNLIGNALRHGAPPVLVRAEPLPGAVRISVTDAGPRLSDEERTRVFERFYRTDPSRDRATGGAGLGLAIARQLVEAQGGRIGVDAEPGGGNRFWFALPAADAGGAEDAGPS